MRLFLLVLLSREHPKAQPSRRLFLLFFEKPGTELATPGLQGERLIHCTTEALSIFGAENKAHDNMDECLVEKTYK